MMKNEGKLIAHDVDRFRLRPIFERLTRAGVTNCEVISAQERRKLEAAGPFDCVLIDAPCSGSGVVAAEARRQVAADRKSSSTSVSRIRRQVLEKGFNLVKPGGRLVYITCSVLPEENTDQVAAFLARHPEMKIIPYAEQWAQGHRRRGAGFGRWLERTLCC